MRIVTLILGCGLALSACASDQQAAPPSSSQRLPSTGLGSPGTNAP